MFKHILLIGGILFCVVFVSCSAEPVFKIPEGVDGYRDHSGIEHFYYRLYPKRKMHIQNHCDRDQKITVTGDRKENLYLTCTER